MSENAADEDTVWFHSKKSVGLVALLFVPPIGASLTLVGVIREGRPLLGLLLVAITLAVFALFLVPTRYGIGAHSLVVRTGVLRARVPLTRIRSVQSNRAWSSPALSQDGLLVSWGDGRFERTRLAPKDRDAFLECLAAKTGLVRDGDDLSKRSVVSTDSVHSF